MEEQLDRPSVRLAEVVGSMSLATDLGLGQPMEHVIRSCLIGLRLGDVLDLDEAQKSATYYVALLAWVGCHAAAHEETEWFGDDIALKAAAYPVDMKGLQATAFALRHVGKGASSLQRARLLGSFLVSGHKEIEANDATACRIAGQLALRLGLGAEVWDGLQHVTERWDGKGTPAGLKGDELALPARIVQLADIAEYFRRSGGIEAATSEAARRRGSHFDPELVDAFRAHAPKLLADLESATAWNQVIEAEPALQPALTDEELDSALEAVADFADLKSPYTSGHSRGVAALAAQAARHSGLPTETAQDLRRAGLLHDLGRLGVSNAIWDKRGALSQPERERVRIHPYLTERMLTPSPGLARFGHIAAQHHERIDGSGYPHGLVGAALSYSARILAAADAYQAMTEPRSHRPARTPDQAAQELRSEARSGRLDGDAVSAVLTAAGHRVPARREYPAGLTRREVDVLRMLARGHSDKEIARELHISPKTVGTHVEHIYKKIEVSTRAGASLFAMQHGLLDDLSSNAAVGTSGTAGSQAGPSPSS